MPHLLPFLALSLALQAQEDLGSLMEKARLARDQGRYQEALQAYDGMLAIAPDHETALLERAQTLSWAGRYSEAIEGYRQFRSLHPQRALDADLRIAQVQAWSGDYSSATDTLDPWVRQRQKEAVLDDATYRAWQGRLDESLDLLEAWLKEHEDDRQAMLLRARFRSWTGRMEKAELEFEAVIARYPGDVEALLGMARLRIWAGDPDGARILLERVNEEGRRLPDAQLLEAQCEAAEGHPSRARARLIPLAERGPAQREARELLADLVDSDGTWIEVRHSRTDTNEGLHTEDPEIHARLPVYDGRLDLGLARHNARFQGNEHSPTEIAAGLSYPFGSRWRASGSVQRFSDIGGSSALGHAAGLVFRPLPGVDVRVDYALSLLIFTPLAIEMRNSIRTVDLGAGWTTPNGLNRLEAGLGYGSLSAGSTRSRYLAAFEHRFPWSLGDFRAGVMTRGFGYSETLPLGFFNPESYHYYGFTGGVSIRKGRVFSMGLDVRYGWQTVNHDPGQTTWGYGLSASWNPSAIPFLSLFASWSETVAGLPVVDPTDPETYREHTLIFGVRFRGPARWYL